MGFAKADKPGTAGVLQNLRVFSGNAALEQSTACFGGSICAVKQVFPADRHTIKRATAGAGLSTAAGGFRLGKRALGGGAGKNEITILVVFDGVQKGLGEGDRIKFSGLNFTP